MRARASLREKGAADARRHRRTLERCGRAGAAQTRVAPAVQAELAAAVQVGLGDPLGREDRRRCLRMGADDEGGRHLPEPPAGADALDLSHRAAAVAAGAHHQRIRPAADAVERRVVAAVEEVLHRSRQRGQVLGRAEQVAVGRQHVVGLGLGGAQPFDLHAAFAARRVMGRARHLRRPAGGRVPDDEQPPHAVQGAPPRALPAGAGPSSGPTPSPSGSCRKNSASCRYQGGKACASRVGSTKNASLETAKNSPRLCAA